MVEVVHIILSSAGHFVPCITIGDPVVEIVHIISRAVQMYGINILAAGVNPPVVIGMQPWPGIPGIIINLFTAMKIG